MPLASYSLLPTKVFPSSLVAQQVKDLAFLHCTAVPWVAAQVGFNPYCCVSFLFLFLFFFFLLFWAAPVAYGRSQARGPIGAAAASLHTATATRDLSCVCNLNHSSRQHQILTSPREARDRTCILMDTNQIRFP